MSIGSDQRQYLEEVARRIEAQESLSAMDRATAAAAIRAAARTIPDEPKRPPGAAPKFNPHDAALLYYAMTRGRRVSVYKARQALSRRYGVSTTAIKEMIEKYGSGAASLFDAIGIPEAE